MFIIRVWQSRLVAVGRRPHLPKGKVGGSGRVGRISQDRFLTGLGSGWWIRVSGKIRFRTVQYPR